MNVVGDDMVEISVVMPVYNGEKYLKESIKSVLMQSFTNFELILVNDCSTDNSLKIMKEFANKDSRVRIIENKKNQKLPKSLNIGFSHAKGKYLTWTSDDNRYRKNALQEMYWYLENHSKVGMVCANMDYIDEKGDKKKTVITDTESICLGNNIGACFLYRHEVIDLIGEYDPDMFLVEDYDYWLRISKKMKIDHIDLNLYEYRYHSSSLTLTRQGDIKKQLFKMRLRELNYILEHIGNDKDTLFASMCSQDPARVDELASLFYGEHSIPECVKWVRNIPQINDRPIILFGAGDYGSNALGYLGKERVVYFVDNNTEIIGQKKLGIEIISFDYLKKIYRDFQIILSVGERITMLIAEQLVENGIDEFIPYLTILAS